MTQHHKRRVESQIKRWVKHVSPKDAVSIYSGDEWRRSSGKSTDADLVVCCDTKLRSMLRRAEGHNASEYDTEVMEVFSEMIGDAGYYYKLKPTHIEIHSMKIENPEKQDGKAKEEWKSVKERARGAGRKIKSGAKSDMGRGAIGAGTGALLLGPIGAAAGAGIALATKKDKGNGRKKNPSSKIKLNSMMGNLLLDHHKVSKDVEHLATITLRGDSATVDQIRRARNDLITSAPSARPSDREQREDLAESLTRLLEKKSKGNPYSSIKSDIKRRRLSKASSSAVRASSAADAAGTAKRMSLRKRLAKINPGSYSEQVAHLSDGALDSEHKAISSLISRAKKSPDTSKRMVADLLKIRKSITEEKARRRKSIRPQGRGISRSANPTKLTKLPAGTKIKRLPPGKAKGAEPLTPYLHEHTEHEPLEPYLHDEHTEQYERNGSLVNPGKARLAELRKKMPRGVKLNYEPKYREYRVTYRGREYFTTDPNDAVGTANMMVSPKVSSHKSAASNPRTVGRKKGKFQSLYTPSESDLRLLRKYDAIEALEGLDPRAIEKFISRLREVDSRRDKVPLKDADLDKAAELYRKRRKRHMHIITSPGSTPGDVARSQRRLDAAERKIALIAEMRNMEPADLRRYMESRSKGVVVNPGKAKSRSGKNKRKGNPGKREIHSDRVERPRTGKKLPYRDFVAVFTKGKYSDGKGKYTMEIFAPSGDSVGVTRSALPYKKASSVFKSATDAHLDLRISMDDALKLSLTRMQQSPFEHSMSNPSLGNLRSDYKTRAQSLAALVKGNTAYIESLEETMSLHGKSEELELDVSNAKSLQAEMCRKIMDGSKLAKYGKKVKWDSEKLKNKAGTLPTMTPEEAGALNAVGELKAFACISEYAEKMGAC